MTKNEIVELYNNLHQIKNLKGSKFNYAIAKNINILKPEVEAIQETAKPRESFVEYDTARIELCKKHAKKDEQGEAVMKGGDFDIEDMKAFDKELKKLQETHKQALDDRETQMKELDALLKEESPIELHKITLSDIPEDITTVQMNSIFTIIE